MEWRDRVLARLCAAMDAYEGGDADLPRLQSEFDAAAAVLESPDADLAAALRQAEAGLDSIAFTVDSRAQPQAVRTLIGPLREQIGCDSIR